MEKQIKVDMREAIVGPIAIGAILLGMGGIPILVRWSSSELADLVFPALAVVAGLLLVSHRQFVQIDPANNRVMRKRGFGIAWTMRTVPLAGIRKVALTSYYVSSSNDNSSTERYRLSIIANQGGPVAEFGNRWFARRKGEQLSAALSVPFDNVLYDAHSMRQPDELDVPLVERWRQSAENAKDCPVIPTGLRLRIADDEDETQISYPANSSIVKYLVMIEVALITVLACAYLLWHGPGRFLTFAILIGVIGLFGCGIMAYSGRSKLKIRADMIEFRQGVSPFTQQVKLMAIEEMIMSQEGIQLVSDTGAVCVDWPADSADADFLKDYLRYEMLRRAPRGPLSNDR
jgi:hypothetical protein